MDNYKLHAFIHTQHTQQKYPHLPKPSQKDWIFFFCLFEKNKRGPCLFGRKIDKRLGNFVVIFIYLKERHCVEIGYLYERSPKFLPLTILPTWLGGGTVVSNFINYIITFFQISFFMSILNLLYSSILKIIAGVIILREVFELILTRRTYM